MKNQKLESVQRLASRIRSLREKAKWSQAVLAEKAGLTDGAIKMIETARRQPRAETLEAIAAALTVSVEDLYQVDSSKPDPALEYAVDRIERAIASRVAAPSAEYSGIPQDIIDALLKATPAQLNLVRGALGIFDVTKHVPQPQTVVKTKKRV